MTTNYDWRKPEVGDIVYPGYAPAKAGRIVTVQQNGSVIVRQPNGEDFKSWSPHLKCLRSLITDHKRKLKTHEKKLKEIEEVET